ncbi:MAG: HAMP domain-containing histidine kinase [Myxococcales bacterium]|nr:HAMP domain-containing histidine kinase [Myxococcales bacterium]MCB9750526.1 HAMP domain-containing histidine kinase [Myxococcales bacterium]
MAIRSRHTRSISLPVVLSSVAVTLALAMIVGWTLIIVRNRVVISETDIVANHWVLIAGIVSLALIITVIVLFLFFLLREIREVRRQTSFIDSVTHELKSPLAALKLCLETLARDGIPAGKREQLREMMLDDVDRLTAFIDRVLTATRISQERAPQPVSEFSLRGLVERCLGVVGKRSREPLDAVAIEIDPELALATDEVALGTVIENLIDNAIKYSPPGAAELRITARVDARGRVLIEVRDQGIGIPRAHLKRVFERFYRVPNEDVRERRGTGLGLYVVSALTRSLGGRVEAHSQGPGLGATMCVQLPASARSVATPQSLEAEVQA